MESKNKKKVNLMIGRYQPMHSGHYRCVETAWKEKHVPTVICMIEVPEAKVDKRHPFPTDMLINLYDEWFKKDPKIERILTVRTADIVKINEMLKAIDKDYQIVSLTCGTDRVKDYQWMYKYKEQADLPEDFEIIEIKRTDEDVSATKARQALLDNNKEEFFKLVPSISLSTRLKKDVYGELREQILKVYEKS